MAKNTQKSNSFRTKSKKTAPKLNLNFAFLSDRRFQLTIGFFLLGLSLFLFTAFISYLFTGKADQSVVESVQEVGLFQSGLEVENWMKLYGALAAHYFIFAWFGVASFSFDRVFDPLGRVGIGDGVGVANAGHRQWPRRSCGGRLAKRRGR